MMILITLIHTILTLTQVEFNTNVMALIMKTNAQIATAGKSSFAMELNGVVIKTGINMLSAPMSTM